MLDVKGTQETPDRFPWPIIGSHVIEEGYGRLHGELAIIGQIPNKRVGRVVKPLKICVEDFGEDFMGENKGG